MKGRKSCYATGGQIKMMRDIGVKAPREGENEKILAEAKGKTTGIIGPEGVPTKGRIDRPARKMAKD